MDALRSRVPESKVTALSRRTARLCEQIERASQSSPHKEVREIGAQLVDLLSERFEELKELHQMEDEDAVDRINAFEIRIRLAEQKVATWRIPQRPTTKSKRNVKSAA
jgi:hypothetical protein